MTYAAILFDMDGTLLETGPIWDKATRYSLIEHSIKLTEEEHFSLGGLLLEIVLGNKGYDQTMIDSIRAVRDAQMVPMIADMAKWREGALDLIQKISVQKAIVTSAHKPVVDAIDHALGIRALFSTVIIADDVRPDFKPNPKGLLFACEKMNVDPAECIYIGDQLCDLQAAANAGMDAILIRGTHTPPEVTHEREVRDFEELTSMLSLS